jgi:hypothetical protein
MVYRRKSNACCCSSRTETWRSKDSRVTCPLRGECQWYGSTLNILLTLKIELRRSPMLRGVLLDVLQYQGSIGYAQDTVPDSIQSNSSFLARSSQYTIATTWKLGLHTGGHAYSTFVSRPWYSYKAPFACMVFFPCLTCSHYACNWTLSCTSEAMGPGLGVCTHSTLT